MTRMLRRYGFGWVAVLAAVGVPVHAVDLFVAPGGDDGNPGTIDEPWATIQHAANTAAAGDVVNIRGGVYEEQVTLNVSGAEDLPIVFQSHPDENAIIDGTNLTVPAAENGLIFIEARSWITIKDLELRNYRTNVADRTPVAIHLRGAAQHIDILGCTIHDIESLASGVFSRNAHGIAVYGTDSVDSCNEIVIDGNEVYDLTLGSSEAIVLNGNVELFRISNNEVHDCDNIGIDCIGFEGTASDDTVDQARLGLISGNHVWNIDSLDNPSYQGERSAGGIYIDGGRQIQIDRNIIHDCNIGIEIASEHKGRATSLVVVTNNLVRQCHVAGLAMGGYDEDRGSTEECQIVNNTFFKNDSGQTGSGELMIQYDTRDNVIRNNIFRTRGQNLVLTNPFVENVGNVLNNNQHYAPGGSGSAEYEWKGVSYNTWLSYKSATGNDGSSNFGDPMFVLNGTIDLHLLPGSPAIDSGNNGAVPMFTPFDLDGGPRIIGIVDRGCYEVFEGTCSGDLDGDGIVGFTDLVQLIGTWGPCASCVADLDMDSVVGFGDLLDLLARWGPCETP